MGDAQLGSWDPAPRDDVVGRFAGASIRWWIVGGIALELHVGRSWRDHDDLDVGVLRTDVPAVRDVLDGWDCQVASRGVLRPWNGGRLEAERAENNLWCRPAADAPWAIDITVGDGTDEHWVYRRDPAVRIPWDEAVLRADGVPYLAPELQLLFKSTSIRPKDQVDAEEVIPSLEPARRQRLSSLLDGDHRWQALFWPGFSRR